MAESQILHHKTGYELKRYLENYSLEDIGDFLRSHRLQLTESIVAAIKSTDLNLLKFFIEPLDDASRYSALSKTCRIGYRPLHHCILNDNSASVTLNYMISCIPVDKRKEWAMQKNSLGQTALHLAAANSLIASATALLDLFTTEQRFVMIAQPSSHRKSVLQSAVNDKFRKAIVERALQGDVITVPLSLSWTKQPAAHSSNGRCVYAGICVECSMQRGSKKEGKSPNINRKKRPKVRHRSTSSDHRADLHRSNSQVIKLSIDPALPFRDLDYHLEGAVVSGDADHLMNRNHLVTTTGMTLLHLAAQKQNLDVIKKIMAALDTMEARKPVKSAKQALIKCRCDAGKTALHYAAEVDNEAIAILLLTEAGNLCYDLLKGTDNLKRRPKDYAKPGSKLKELLELAETHYWKTFIQPASALVLYNTYEEDDEVPHQQGSWKRTMAEEEKDAIVSALEHQGITARVCKSFDQLKVVQEIRRMKEGSHSCLLVVMMSHGDPGVIYDCEKQPMQIMEIVDLLSTLDASLPKVLILQCCLGTDYPEADPDDGLSADANVTASLQKSLEASLATVYLKKKHMCVICSTLHQKASYRNYFIPHLARVLNSGLNQRPDDLLTVFTETNSRMDAQVGYCMTSLAKRLVLRDPRSVPTRTWSIAGWFKDMFQLNS